MPGRLLVNLDFNSLYRFVCVGFPSHIPQKIQPANNGFIQRFCVDNDTVFGIVAVLQTDNAPAERHDELGSWIRVGDAGKPAYFFLLHKSMNSSTVAGSRFGTCTVTAFTRTQRTILT